MDFQKSIRFINDSKLLIKQTFLSNFVSANRKHYNAKNVLISLIENWKRNLDNNKIAGAVFMDLSKAFDWIAHDLLIAKMEAYGYSIFQILLSGVPEGS